MGRIRISPGSEAKSGRKVQASPVRASCLLLLALLLVLSSCADTAGPRTVDRRKRRIEAQQGEDGAKRRESDEPGERGLGIGDDEQTEDALQAFGEAQVLEGAAGMEDLEALVDGGSLDPVATIAAERRARAEAKRQAELAEVARIQADIERRRNEEAEAKLRAEKARAELSAEQSERSEKSARAREEAEMAGILRVIPFFFPLRSWRPLFAPLR